MINSKTTFRHFLTSIFLLLFLINSASAQKFGKIDYKNIIEESHPIHKDADYSYIFKNSSVSYDLNRRPKIVENYHYRIKVYNEKANNVGDIVHYLGDEEQIKKIKASSFNLVNGQIIETKLDKKDIYKEKVSEGVTKVSFAIPNVKAGTIIEYKYRIYSPRVYAFPRHYFQVDQPVNFSKLEVDVPAFFSMTPVAKGFFPLEIKEDESNISTKFIYTAKDVPPITDDKYVLNTNDIRTSLKFELRTVDFPGQESQVFTKDWESICTNLMESDYFNKAMKKSIKSAQQFIASISEDTEEVKIEKIVDFITTNIAWDKNMGIYGTNSYKRLFEKKEGDAGEINLLLINLLNKAGIEAHPVLTKTRFRGIFNSYSPSLTELNYVFAAIPKGDKFLFVDATSTNYKPGKLPLRALNIQGLLVNEDGGQIINIPNTNLNYAKVAAKYTVDIENQRLNGSGKTTLKDYATVRARNKAKEEDDDDDEQDFIVEEESKKEDYEKDNDDEAEDDEEDEDEDEEEEELEDLYNYISSDGIDEKYGPIKTTFESELYSPITTIDNQVFIDAFVSIEFDENPFLDEVREYPAFFNTKHHINHVSILEIPEGYKLKYRPDNVKMKMINNKGIFSYTINESPNALTVNCLFKINSDTFMPEEYASLYEFFDQVIQKQGEKIILEKI